LPISREQFENATTGTSITGEQILAFLTEHANEGAWSTSELKLKLSADNTDAILGPAKALEKEGKVVSQKIGNRYYWRINDGN